jgi:meso-butanediol dehydrogenase/(S,S)-butanediol dehydrogenase/diacetyl reductase
MRPAERVVLVTGGASGIGRAVAQLAAAEGAEVVVADRDRDGAEETVARITEAGGAGIAVEVDVSDAPAVAAMTARAEAAYGKVDVLVNNAGASRGDDILDIDEAAWDWNLAVVLKSAFLCSKALLPGMIARRRGAIVNVASVNGLVGLGEEGYSAAKAGMINLTQNMAVKYGRFGVRANVVCPGTIRTPIWNPRLERNPAIFDELAAWYPLGRVGEPEDVARAVLFLASDNAAWITGAVLPVDGGLTAGSYRMTRDLEGDATTSDAIVSGTSTSVTAVRASTRQGKETSKR